MGAGEAFPGGSAPCFSGGLRPPDPPKGAPRPWLQRLFAFSRPSHLSGAAALPGAELFLKNRALFEQATCPVQLRCQGQNLFPEIRLFSEEATCPGQLRCQGQIFQISDCFMDITPTISKHTLSESLGAQFAEQNVGLKNRTFRYSNIPVRRTNRRKSQTMHSQEF